MAKLYNLARMTTATTGTGTITLGSAATGWLSFANAGVSDGDTVTYAIVEGNNREIGRGVYTAAGTTLTRTVLKSTNSNTAITLGGSAQVFITSAAEDINTNGPAFGAYQSSAQSALSANTWTKVSLQTEEFDTDNCFDSTTNYRFQPNVAGYYFVTACGQFTNASSALAIAQIYKNGSQFKQSGYIYMPSFNSSGNAVSVSSLIQMNGTTDYLEFWMFCDTARSIQTGQNITYFNGFLARNA